jgi:hypothetical protein
LKWCALGIREQAILYENVCRSVKVPVMLQDADFTGGGLAAKLFVDLAERCPNFEFAKPEIVLPGTKCAEIIRLSGGKLQVLYGLAGVALMDGFAHGAMGVMPGPAFTEVLRPALRALRFGPHSRSQGAVQPDAALSGACPATPRGGYPNREARFDAARSIPFGPPPGTHPCPGPGVSSPDGRKPSYRTLPGSSGWVNESITMLFKIRRPPGSSKYLASAGVEILECGEAKAEGGPGQLLLVARIQLVLTNVFRTQLFRRLLELARDCNLLGIGANGLLGVIPESKILDHALA